MILILMIIMIIFYFFSYGAIGAIGAYLTDASLHNFNYEDFSFYFCTSLILFFWLSSSNFLMSLTAAFIRKKFLRILILSVLPSYFLYSLARLIFSEFYIHNSFLNINKNEILFKIILGVYSFVWSLLIFFFLKDKITNTEN